MRRLNKFQGFTLIELLVVISIISLLSSVIFASLNSARSKARDSARKQTLVQLRNALELYYTDQGSYPSTGGVWYASALDLDLQLNGGDWIPGLAPKYIASLPQDPLGGTISSAAFSSPSCHPYSIRVYLYISNGKDYKVLCFCSTENPVSSNDTFADHRPYSYQVSSPGANSW